MIEIEYHWLGLALLAGGLASVHIWFPWFDERFSAQAARWLGFVGGVATGYVILYLLPKIARQTALIIGLDEAAMVDFLDLQLYYLLLAAIVTYLLNVHLGNSQKRWRILAPAFDYSVHGAYSFLRGYVFVEISSGSSGYLDVNLVVSLILGLHLMGMNHILRSTRKRGYDSVARWVYCALIMLGAGLGLTTELPKMFINSLGAFLAGIILINVISEELPLQQQQRVPWYILGICVFLLAFFFVLRLDPPNAYA